MRELAVSRSCEVSPPFRFPHPPRLRGFPHARPHRRRTPCAPDRAGVRIRADAARRLVCVHSSRLLSRILPTTRRRRFDLRMHKYDHARRGAIPDPADELALVENLVAELRRIVPHDVIVGHLSTPAAHRLAATALPTAAACR